jgi:hypothetical protein
MRRALLIQYSYDKAGNLLGRVGTNDAQAGVSSSRPKPKKEKPAAKAAAQKGGR